MNLADIIGINNDEQFIYEIPHTHDTISMLKKYRYNELNEVDRINNYLFYLSYSKHEMDSAFLDDDLLEFHNNLVKLLEQVCSLSISEYNKLINKHYIYLIDNFVYCKNEILLLANNNGIRSEVRKYLVSNNAEDFFMPEIFDRYIDFFKKDAFLLEDWLNKLLRKGIYFFDESLTDYLLRLNHSNCNNVIQNFCKNITIDFEKRIKEKLTNTDSDRVFYAYDSFFKWWTPYLKEIKSTEIFYFEKLEEPLKEKFNDVLDKHSHSFSYEIDATGLMNIFKQDIEANGFIMCDYFNREVFLSFEEAAVATIYDLLFETNKNCFNRTQSDILREIMYKLGYVVNHAIFVETEKIISSLKSYIKYIDSEFCINDAYKLECDFDVLFEMYRDLSLKDETDKFIRKISLSNYYGPTMYICNLIEKTLRNFYLYQRKDIDFTDNKYITLNFLLSEENEVIYGLLGKSQLEVMRYYLISSSRHNGLNIRNELAHLDYNYDDKKIFDIFIHVNTLLFLTISSIILY